MVVYLVVIPAEAGTHRATDREFRAIAISYRLR